MSCSFDSGICLLSRLAFYSFPSFCLSLSLFLFFSASPCDCIIFLSCVSFCVRLGFDPQPNGDSIIIHTATQQTGINWITLNTLSLSLFFYLLLLCHHLQRLFLFCRLTQLSQGLFFSALPLMDEPSKPVFVSMNVALCCWSVTEENHKIQYTNFHDIVPKQPCSHCPCQSSYLIIMIYCRLSHALPLNSQFFIPLLWTLPASTNRLDYFCPIMVSKGTLDFQLNLDLGQCDLFSCSQNITPRTQKAIKTCAESLMSSDQPHRRSSAKYCGGTDCAMAVPRLLKANCINTKQVWLKCHQTPGIWDSWNTKGWVTKLWKIKLNMQN